MSIDQDLARLMKSVEEEWYPTLLRKLSHLRGESEETVDLRIRTMIAREYLGAVPFEYYKLMALLVVKGNASKWVALTEEEIE